MFDYIWNTSPKDHVENMKSQFNLDKRKVPNALFTSFHDDIKDILNTSIESNGRSVLVGDSIKQKKYEHCKLELTQCLEKEDKKTCIRVNKMCTENVKHWARTYEF